MTEPASKLDDDTDEPRSCSPNARYTFNKPTFTSRLRAVRDIKAGEEITITYSRLDVPSAVRQKDLAPYGFVCTCDACRGGAESDAQRAKIPSEISPALKRGRIEPLLDLVALIEREKLQDLPVYVDSLMAVVDKYVAQKDFARCQPYLDKIQQYVPLNTDGIRLIDGAYISSGVECIHEKRNR